MFSIKLSLKVKYIFYFLCLFVSKTVFSEAILNTKEIRDQISIVKYSGIYIEPEDQVEKAAIDQLISNPGKFDFISADSDNLNYGYSRKTYWLKFAIQNDLRDTEEYTMVFEYPLVGNLDLYTIHENSGKRGNDPAYLHAKSGWYLPFSFRSYDFRKPNLNLTLKHGLNVFYLKIKTKSPVNISINLYNNSSLIPEISYDQIINGFYIGLIAAMLLFNIFMYIILRDKLVLYYIYFVFFWFLFNFAYKGYIRQYFWPDAPWQIMYTTMTSLGLASFFMIYFFISFLELKKNSRIILFLVYALMSVIVISTLCLYINFSLGATGLIIGGTLVLLTFFIVGIIRMINGEKYVRFIILGSFFFLFGAILTGLHESGILKNEYYTQYLPLGMILWIAMISLALTDKYQILNKRKLNIQKEKILEQKNYKSVLKLEVAEKTKEIQQEKNLLESRVKGIVDELAMGKSIREKLLTRENKFEYISFLCKMSESIGGDYFEIFHLEDNTAGILMANVSGHGIQAVFNMLIFKTIILELEERKSNPADLVFHVNAFLRNHSIHIYLTLFYGIYSKETRNMKFCIAGHAEPLIIRPDSVVPITGEKGLALGVVDNDAIIKAGKKYENVNIQFNAGEKILIYSEGFLKFILKEYGKLDISDALYKYIHSTKKNNLPSKIFISQIEDELHKKEKFKLFAEELCLVCLDVN